MKSPVDDAMYFITKFDHENNLCLFEDHSHFDYQHDLKLMYDNDDLASVEIVTLLNNIIVYKYKLTFDNEEIVESDEQDYNKNSLSPSSNELVERKSPLFPFPEFDSSSIHLSRNGNSKAYSKKLIINWGSVDNEEVENIKLEHKTTNELKDDIENKHVEQLDDSKQNHNNSMNELEVNNLGTEMKQLK
jgi:hypothetical protein